jgi:hypothetical protein
MGISKRRIAMRLAALEEERRWEEYRRKNPLPPPPPWTDGQLAELDRMRSILNELLYGQSRDINLISEFLRYSYLFDGISMSLLELARKSAHYRELEQYAAKEKLWGKMHGLLYGLQLELDSLRRRRERGGTGVQ